MSNVMDRQLRSLARRARLSVGRAIIRLVSDVAGLQTAQVSLMANETRSNIERMQEYGFTSVPFPGAEAAVIFVGGERGNGIIIACEDRRYRLKGLQNGEVALYTDEGDKIHFKRGRAIDIETLTLNISAPMGVNIDTQTLSVTGDIIDNSNDNGVTVEDMRDTYNVHTHNENETAGGPTNGPNQPMG